MSGSIALSLIYHRAVSSRHINRLPPFLVDNDQSVQVELVSRYPIKYVWIEPYLALNRMDLRVELPDFEDSNTPTHVHPYDASINSIEEISQEIQTETSITIDDLDLGFKVDGRGDLQTAISSLGRRLFGTPEIIMDKGIPVFHLIQRQSHNDAWERKVDPKAFGMYRRTFVVSRTGVGQTFAKFTTELPHTGDWRLEYFLPKGQFDNKITYMGMRHSVSLPYFVGKVRLNVRNNSASTTTTFDASNLNSGWHAVGDYSLTDEGSNRSYIGYCGSRKCSHCGCHTLDSD